IKGGIARAREQLGEAAPPAQISATPEAAAVRLQIEVDPAPALAKEVRPDDSVSIFARAVSGPAIPLAPKRLTVAELPEAITLGDADAMMPQLKMSNYPEVTLVARISRQGNATKGEWMGQSEALKTAEGDKTVRLTIDQPDTP